MYIFPTHSEEMQHSLLRHALRLECAFNENIAFQTLTTKVGGPLRFTKIGILQSLLVWNIDFLVIKRT